MGLEGRYEEEQLNINSNGRRTSQVKKRGGGGKPLGVSAPLWTRNQSSTYFF